MAQPIDAQLRRFQLDPEAFDLAKQIRGQAQVKTAPGSGHELGAGVIAVPAIAAYLACVHLNSTDVDYNTAASASCVRPVIFKKILGIVQDLVEIGPFKSRTEECDGDAVTYMKLIQVFGLRRYQPVLLGWFESAKAALLGSGELRDSDVKVAKNVTLLRCVVFAWVCETSKSQRIEPKMVKLKYGLPGETFDNPMRIMSAACSHIKAQIHQDRQALLKNNTLTSSASLIPSKPRHDNSSVSRSVSKPRSKSTLKRKLSALEGAEQDTPSKRVALMKSMPEVDEGEPSEDEAMGVPSKRRIRLFADGAGAAVMPMARLQPEEGPTMRDLSRPQAPSLHITDVGLV